MFYFLIIFSIAFIAVVFYLAKVVVMQLEQKADEDVLSSKEVYQKIIAERSQAITEKAKLEREAAQIFTLYEMTREVASHFNEQYLGRNFAPVSYTVLYRNSLICANKFT